MVLLQRSQGSPLLPRLQELIIDGSLGGLISLLAPTVHNLNLVIPHASADARTSSLLAHTVRPHLCHVRTLVLNEYFAEGSGPRRGITIPKLIDVCALTHLESLEVVHPVIAKRTLIQALITFPNLRFLCLAFEFCRDERNSLEASAFPQGFFELRHLDLTASYGDLALFLEVTNPPRLETLALGRELERWEDPGFEDLPQVYAKIPPNLCHFHVRYHVYQGNFDAAGGRVNQPLLTPSRVLPPSLYAFHDLREVFLKFGNVTRTLENDDLAALCAAWPALEDFQFDDNLYYEDDASRLPTLTRCSRSRAPTRASCAFRFQGSARWGSRTASTRSTRGLCGIGRGMGCACSG